MLYEKYFRCNDGWTGKRCENRTDICKINPPVCMNNGTCVPVQICTKNKTCAEGENCTSNQTCVTNSTKLFRYS